MSGRGRDTALPFAGSLPQQLHYLGLGQVDAKSQELHFGLPRVWQWPRNFHFSQCLYSQLHLQGPLLELEHQCSSTVAVDALLHEVP